MRKEDRYLLREQKIPYYFDDIIVRTKGNTKSTYPGVYIKMYEIFDGEIVRWGVREEYNSVFDDRVCKSTPLFENIVDESGKDKERIIYLGDSKFIFHGKINGSEVLCKLNDDVMSEDFYKIEDFPGENVTIEEIDKDTVLAKFKLDGLNRCMYFKYRDFRPCSNVFDFVDASHYFLKTYVLNGKVRRFLGQINEDGTMVKPYGYDIDKKEYFLFPRTEDNLIDDELMMDYITKYNVDSLNYDFYVTMGCVDTFLMSLGTFCIVEKINLDELNNGNVKTK